MNRIAVISKMESGKQQKQPVHPLWNETAEPLILMMKIAGIYHETSAKSDNRVQVKRKGSGWLPDPKPSRSRSWLNRLSRFYHAFVCVYLWLNAIRMTYSVILDVIFGRFMHDHISLDVFYFNVAVNNTIMFAVCCRENCMRLFRSHWNSAITSLNARSLLLQAALNPKAEHMDADPKVWNRHNKFAIITVIICSIIILMNTAALSFLTFAFGTSSSTAKGICGPWPSELFCGINIISATFASSAYFLPLALYSLICHGIAKQFSTLTKEFDQVVKSPRPMDKTVLNCFRRRHAIVCHTVEVTDDIFSPFAGVMYLTNVPIVIFLMYQLFYLAGDLFYIGVTLFWLLASASSISVLSYFTVQVYEKAHSLRRRVHELQMDTFDSDLAQIQMLFLARLDGPDIGMTALGCFVITKERVLAVVSTLITFFTILLQFQGLCPSDDVTMATANVSTTTGAYTS